MATISLRNINPARFDYNVYMMSSVGIGTASPAYQVDIENSSNAVLRLHAGTNASASVRLKNDAQDWDVNCQTTDKFAIYNQTAGVQAFTIDTSNNVGIGAANPLSKIHIRASANQGTNFRDQTNGSLAIRFDITNYTSGRVISMLEGAHSANDGLPPATRIATKVTNIGSLLLFGTSNSYAGGITNTALSINHVGRIGINTESPSCNLDIYRSDTATNNEIRLRRSDLSSTYCEWSYNSGTARLKTIGSDHLELGTNNSTHMTIHGSSGSVGIGTTNPAYKLDVNGTIRCKSLMFEDGTTFSSVSGVGQKAIAVNIGNGSSNVVARARSVVDASYGGITNGMVIVYYYWYYTYRCGNGTCGANHYQKSVYNVISGTWTHIFNM